MNLQEFDKVLENRINLIRSVLSSKGKEYSLNNDRLHNFNKAAVILDESREKALMGMAIKHFISILDMINLGKLPDEKVLEEKIGDMINYLILLEASFIDDIKHRSNTIKKAPQK